MLTTPMLSRHGHVIIGGKDTNGNPLSDAWVRIGLLISADSKCCTHYRNSIIGLNSGLR